ncbi:MAG TPA: flagellar export chaperone FliS [Burkholderiaceae bacterium]|nr:flagellar export chaperone FliS [Burkholderiaceae bacterium]
MAGFGAKAYQSVAVQTSVATADPHRMTLLLYDGAIEAIRLALGHMGTRRIAAKCEAIGKAVCILEEGLKASVDRKAGGQLADRLVALYEYITLRLLQANLHNDRKALDEAHKLLGDLRSAWAQIGQTVARPADAAAAPVRTAVSPARSAAGAPART